MVVGIDLGTTYSAVAIPEQRTGEGFYNLRECPGYSVVLDQRRRTITPSVVAEDDAGGIVVGYAAKGRVGLVPDPIMFAKRWMGEEKTFQLNKQGLLQPRDVSQHILKYLVQMTAQRIGEPVEEAVITVPAYFNMKAKQNTEEAARMAGLRVAQIVQEPVAAAIMYCANDPRDPLRVMTYDLGGGTFDIAILEKRDGTISTASMLAFDGDRFLGGYNFDKALTHWLLDQLVARGYDMDLDLNSPADKLTFAKLMVIAERIKIGLTDKETLEVVELSTGITDRRGDPVAIELEISRTEFEALIRAEVDYSIGLCHRARLEKAKSPIDTASLDEILLVGGSSQIPLVRRRLREEFGREPRLVQPNLCVALGAAMIAATQPKKIGCLKLGRVPGQTDLPSIEVTGNVVATAELPKVGGASVSLRSHDGSYQSTRAVGADGAFAFQNVALAEGETTDFVLTVNSAGATAATVRFAVQQTATPAAGPLIDSVTNVLSKPIGILWAGGLEVIAPERTPLPYSVTVVAETTDTSGVIRITVLEGATPLGDLVMTGIPNTLPTGSVLDVRLSISEKYKIEVAAYIRALSQPGSATMDIPARRHKPLHELEAEFQLLRARAKDALTSAGPNALFGDANAKRLEDRLEDCDTLLHDRRRAEPERIQDCMDEIEGLIRAIGRGWRPDPPKRVFDEAVLEADAALTRAKAAKPEIARDGYEGRIGAIQKEGEKAYADQNPASWKASYKKILEVTDQLQQRRSPQDDGTAKPPPDPALMMVQVRRELSETEQSLKKSDPARHQQLQKEFKDLAQALERIHPKAPDATTQIRDWYFTHFQSLKDRIDQVDSEGRPKPKKN